MAYIIETPNAFEPTRASKYVLDEDITIRQWVERKHPSGEFPVPTVCIVNGEAVKRKDWNRKILDKDIVNFVAIPAGIETALLIALVVIAIGVTLYFTLNQPKVPGEQPGSDPVFSTKGQQNEIRLGEPIECPYGRNRMYPSLAARPYFEYRDNEQFQFMLMCLGHGQYDIHQIMIGDTDIDNFQEVEYEIIEPGGTVTLIPNAVYTSPEAGGQTLYGPNEPEYVAPGWIGPFPANPAGTEARSIQVDVVLPKGLYRMDKKGKLVAMGIDFEIEIRLIDDLGSPLGPWEDLGGTATFNIVAKTTTPQRRTFRETVTAGRYEVRMRRTSDTSLNHNAGHEIVWEALRSYIDEEQDFGEVTLIAVIIRATNNLNNQTQQRFNVLATRKLPIRYSAESGDSTVDSEGWSEPIATRSIVWALVDVFRSLYGGRITNDVFFDWDALVALDALYESRNEHFDWVFRDPITVWEAARAVARVGRATPLLSGSLITMKRDGPLELPVAMFNQENIVEGSFDYGIKLWDLDEHDSIRIEYTEPDTGYKQEQVLCVLPGGTSDHPEDIRFPGIQNRAHAYHEGLYMMAVRKYLRENVGFKTGLEGYIPTFGDLIAVAHDVPEWGQAGYIVHAEQGLGDVYHLWLSEPVVFTETSDYQILLRGRQGEPIGPFTATQTGEPNQVIIHSDSEDIDFLLGGKNEPMLFQFGPSGNITKYLRVVKIEPQGGEQIQITGVNDAPEIHSFDELEPPALASIALAPVPPALPEISELRLTQIDDSLHIVQASWTAAFGAQYYIIQTSQDGTSWSETITTTRTSYQFQTFPGPLWVRVAAVNEGQGEWIEETMNVDFLLGLVLAEQTGMEWRVEWQLALLATSYIVRVYDNTGSEPVLKRVQTRYSRGFSYTYEDAVLDDNVVREMLVEVTPDFEDDDDEEPVSLEISLPVPEAPSNLGSELYSLDSDSVLYRLFWDVPEENDLIRIKVWLELVSGFDPEVEVPILDELTSGGWESIPTETFVDIPLDSDGTHPAYYWRVALFDLWGNEISTNISPEQTIPAYP